MRYAIDARGVTKVYGEGDVAQRVLEGCDVQVPHGEFMMLVGPSGSGKTTLLNLLAGIDRATAGSLRVEGHDLAKFSRAELANWRADNVGYIFQLYNLIPVLTAYENVELPLLLKPMRRAERHRRVAAALDVVGIADRHDHYPRQLSGGQEQRVAIARAIVTEPKLLVADEPTGDLDKSSAAEILALLGRLNRDLGCTMVMVTHDPHAADHARKTLHLEKGRLVETPEPSLIRPMEVTA